MGSRGRNFSYGGYSDAQRIKRKVKVHGHDTDESQRSNSHGLPPADQLTCSAARCRRRYKYTHAGLCMSRRRHGNAHNTQNMTTPRPACRPPHAGTNIVFSMKKKADDSWHLQHVNLASKFNERIDLQSATFVGVGSTSVFLFFLREAVNKLERPAKPLLARVSPSVRRADYRKAAAKHILRPRAEGRSNAEPLPPHGANAPLVCPALLPAVHQIPFNGARRYFPQKRRRYDVLQSINYGHIKDYLFNYTQMNQPPATEDPAAATPRRNPFLAASLPASDNIRNMHVANLTLVAVYAPNRLGTSSSIRGP